MPLVHYTPEHFAAHHGDLLQASQDLAFSWPELVWAAVTVGRAELFHVVRYGDYSLFEMSYRTAILYANLCELDTRRMTRSSAYDGLDPTEKGAVSYFLGMAVTKAAVHRVCSVPWLMHLDVYRADLDATMNDARNRPDLLGRDNLGRWVVVESKGRTNGFDGRALERAKQQAQAVVDIGGEAPYLAVGALVHFDGGVLQLHFRDPTPSSETKVSLPLSDAKFFEGYYRPFREWLRREPSARPVTIRGRTFLEAPIEQLDLSVGLEEGREALPTPERVRSDLEFSIEFTREQREDLFVGADGILVRLGQLWNSNNMRRQPQERTRTR